MLALTFIENFIQILARALAMGGIYALVALGFVLIFKATQTVNFAQGGIALMGGWFLSLLAVDWLIPERWISSKYVSWLLSLVIASLLTALLGLVLERTIIRPMIGKPLFSIAVITLGAESVLRTIGTDAVNINPRVLAIPWGGSSFKIGEATVGYTYIAIYLATILCFLGVFLFFRTRMGTAMRAVATDQEAALAQGISVGMVFAIAWAVSSAIACVAGVLSQGSPLAEGTATVAITGLAFRALPAVILGGLDSLKGALVGGLLIGAAEVFAGAYLSGFSWLGNGYSLVVPYVIMLFVLLIRPYGLWGTPEIRRV